LSLWAAVDILRTRQLRLSLVEHLREKFDPFEGTIPQPDKANLDVVLMGAANRYNQNQQWSAHYTPDVQRLVREQRPPGLWTEMEQRREGKRRSTHVSYWMAGAGRYGWCGIGDWGMLVCVSSE